uniref:SPC25 component of NDC80 kinetochore complex n=1 Tax=Cyprinus carpio TaxID=7962 RepID=A0A8C1VNG3_CYPCA
MASIRDYNVVEQFNSRLEEIRSKLLDQAMGEVLSDRVAELCQEHRQYMKAVLGTCFKKCKEDENMFDMIQTFKEGEKLIDCHSCLTFLILCAVWVCQMNDCQDTFLSFVLDLKEKTASLKEKGAEHLEVVSEIEDKEHHKALLFQRIEKLKKDQAKNRELIQSQNKANKDRLKKLNKCKDIFQKHLSLEIRKIQGEKLQFVFRNISRKDPDMVHTFLLQLDAEGVYHSKYSSSDLFTIFDFCKIKLVTIKKLSTVNYVFPCAFELDSHVACLYR